ncbi:MAG TPA: NAD(P)-dependent oxidoreductase [Chloroflexota bacterium]|nr:NAD(P)-dependent oxidoreductase [Chloroflexota bacterium]
MQVLIASPLEAELVARIAAVDEQLEVVYRPDLLGKPRYAGDHTPPVQRTEAQETEWSALLASAEVMFDVDRPNVRAGLATRAPRLRWVQASSSGVGEWIRRLGLMEAPVQVTNAAGIHAAPLAEFALFAMLYFAKRMPLVQADRAARRWERFAGSLLRGPTLGVIGLGRVGREIARLAAALGMRVVGVRRSGVATDGVAEVTMTTLPWSPRSNGECTRPRRLVKRRAKPAIRPGHGPVTCMARFPYSWRMLGREAPVVVLPCPSCTRSAMYSAVTTAGPGVPAALPTRQSEPARCGAICRASRRWTRSGSLAALAVLTR